MAKLGFQNPKHNNKSRSTLRAREPSPDSVIYTYTSLFSSASASVDRTSFASDTLDHDHQLFAKEISQHLSGEESSSGPDPDPNKHNYSCIIRQVDKAKVEREDKGPEVDDGNQIISSRRSSFSLALKECQERRSRSEALSRKSDRPRTASLDLNSPGAGNSPRFGLIKKNLVTHRSGTIPSPGTPNYRNTIIGMQKGWSSERVPLPHNGKRKNISAALSFNNGRTLPSKWEDAERWIISPVSGDGVGRHSFPPQQRRPKAKSGPLGPPGIAYYSLYSPAIPMFEAENMRNLMSGSPFSTGVIAPDASAMQYSCQGGAFPPRNEPSFVRSASVHGCKSMCVATTSQEGSQVEHDGVKDASTNISRDVSRRDMATQMSPEGSTHSSPIRPSTSSERPIIEMQSVQSLKSDVRNVQVDEQVGMTRWSKKQRALISDRESENVVDMTKNGLDAQSSTWEVSETSKSISRAKREDTKITAWENLQKAKAEAAIRKLEMKLEKKRLSSMDKIMKKLKSAQGRAQEMRSSLLANGSHQVTMSSHKAMFFRKARQMKSLSGCFACHVF